MGKQVISSFGALRVMLGQVGTEGLGFSMDAAPPWIASAPFQEDRTVIPELLDRVLGRLLDIMVKVFYLIHGLYIVVTNNGK